MQSKYLKIDVHKKRNLLALTLESKFPFSSLEFSANDLPADGGVGGES